MLGKNARVAIGCLVALLCLSSIEAVSATRLAPSAIVAVCKFDGDHDRANCDAFLRGSVERLEARATRANSDCRTTPFGPDDVASFLRYASAHMLPDSSSEAFVLTFNYWAGNPNGIPCNSVPGYWTTGHLTELCRADNGNGSPCKFYTTALLGFTQIEEVVAKTRYFCPKGDAVRPDAEALENLQSWIAADPRRADEPAALGYVDAMKAAYPC